MGLDSSCLNLASEQTWAIQPACRANWITLTPSSTPPPLSLSVGPKARLPDLHISILTDVRFLRSSHDPIWSDCCQITHITASCSCPALLTHCTALRHRFPPTAVAALPLALLAGSSSGF